MGVSFSIDSWQVVFGRSHHACSPCPVRSRHQQQPPRPRLGGVVRRPLGFDHESRRVSKTLFGARWERYHRAGFIRGQCP
jgi:hypothetical protein